VWGLGFEEAAILSTPQACGGVIFHYPRQRRAFGPLSVEPYRAEPARSSLWRR
jgi:hypothetical protein